MAQLTTHLAPLQGQVLELSQCISDHIATQLELAQEKLEGVIQTKVDAELEKFNA